MIRSEMPPLTVSFSVMDDFLVADRRYDVQCHSAGSRPPASITWYRNDKKLPKIKYITWKCVHNLFTNVSVPRWPRITIERKH
ncbi:protein turtle B-like isoform X2 [Aphis craccivora]|uniref:Protein turtle B-like isoform X2 n=1 Tax=Aphis craccivora TaxID=307492 RepID=A0A6G0YL74_APHCR|nr:protein turtle B-like isoform X2 [Aphis craccivora]